jgi:hypothetical protein
LNLISFGAHVHAYAPHTATELYAAAALSSLAFIIIVYVRCWFTESIAQLDKKMDFSDSCGRCAHPDISASADCTFDADLARSVLDDRVVVALAGLYGLVETLKDIRATASDANKRRNGALPSLEIKS